MKRLEGKVILVTGATGSIGRATAIRLAQEGAKLALADRASSSTDELVTEIAQTGAGTPEIFHYDALDAVSCRALVADVVQAYGRLDGLCNIAGAYAKTSATDVGDDDWNTLLQINLNSTFTLTREAIPHLQKSGGNVVSTSSLAALNGLAYATAYASAKAALIAMTKSLAAEYASCGVRVNVICPGGIRSEMSAIPPVPGADPELIMRRSKLKGFADGLGDPKDIAAGFAYLLSDDARFVSGAVLVIDGAQGLI
ncbi:SDR family NAD(P)-dependent oxidoreductase [Thalassorhabdomicrobium marinisediminis]|uniref:SDR family NAD(P)-dependent oxidoreductase n=1 Tax=Thalassorhabdomicrobium marinisediminis TaxID=2170577 RepID=UPI00249118D9|nr:SDR family NAD(P)-dependent oxidoreductase [Thalassorhabdomicrobium marinisediminis]